MPSKFRVLSRRWALTIIIVVALEGGVFWGAFTFVGADLHQRFGLGFAAIGAGAHPSRELRTPGAAGGERSGV